MIIKSPSSPVAFPKASPLLSKLSQISDAEFSQIALQNTQTIRDVIDAGIRCNEMESVVRVVERLGEYCSPVLDVGLLMQILTKLEGKCFLRMRKVVSQVAKSNAEMKRQWGVTVLLAEKIVRDAALELDGMSPQAAIALDGVIEMMQGFVWFILGAGPFPFLNDLLADSSALIEFYDGMTQAQTALKMVDQGKYRQTKFWVLSFLHVLICTRFLEPLGTSPYLNVANNDTENATQTSLSPDETIQTLSESLCDFFLPFLLFQDSPEFLTSASILQDLELEFCFSSQLHTIKSQTQEPVRVEYLISSLEEGVKGLEWLQDLRAHKRHQAQTPRQLRFVDSMVGRGGGGEMDVPEDTEVLLTNISQIQDVFPDLGDGFLKKCLDSYQNDPQQVISNILENSLPPDLESLDRSLSLLQISDTTSYQANFPAPAGLLIARDTAFPDTFSILADPSTVYHIGKRDANVSLDDERKTGEYKYEYEDEYDDTYDGVEFSRGGEFVDGDEEEVGNEDDRGEKGTSGPLDKALLFLVETFSKDKSVFERAARGSKARVELRNEAGKISGVGVSDEMIEGWGKVVGGNERRMNRLMLDVMYQAPQNQNRAGAEQGDAEGAEGGDDSSRGRGRGQGRGRGSGRGRGRGRGQGGGAGAGGGDGTGGGKEKKREHMERRRGRRDAHLSKMTKGAESWS